MKILASELALRVAAQLPAAEAPKPTAPDFLKTGAITGILAFVAGVLLMVAGVRLLAKSNKGNVKEAANTSYVAIIAVFLIVLGAGGMLFPWIANALGFFATA